VLLVRAEEESNTMIKKIFNIVIEKEEDEEGYSIHCPQLAGLATQGDNIEDALLMFADALDCYMSVIIERKSKV